MSDTDSNPHDRRTVHKTIRRIIGGKDDDGMARSYLLSAVDNRTGPGIEMSDVVRELDALEREGFVYLVGDRDEDGGDPEVKIT